MATPFALVAAGSTDEPRRAHRGGRLHRVDRGRDLLASRLRRGPAGAWFGVLVAAAPSISARGRADRARIRSRACRRDRRWRRRAVRRRGRAA
jgi:hypothetical protein